MEDDARDFGLRVGDIVEQALFELVTTGSVEVIQPFFCKSDFIKRAPYYFWVWGMRTICISLAAIGPGYP